MLGCGGTTADPTATATATLSGTLTMYARAVYLFPLQYVDPSSYDIPTSVGVAPVAQTTSDSTGHYSMHAPPGRWSLFVEDQGHLYANDFESTDDAIAPVSLSEGVETTRDVSINHATW